jgi:hypothetical protein
VNHLIPSKEKPNLLVRRLRQLGWSALCLSGLIVGVCGCSRSEGPSLDPHKPSGLQLHGKVSYNGTLLPYGYVKFAHLTKSRNPRTGLYQTATMATIQPDGTYTAKNVPEGPVVVSVFTDPDEGRPSPSTGLKPPRDFGVSRRGEARQEEVSTTTGMPKRPDPLARKLKPEQIKILKEIHEQFSDDITSGIVIVVTPEPDQEHDFDLKTRVLEKVPGRIRATRK